ncbi:MAG: hypothetical protein WCX65_01550 [bacterium]
MKKQLKAAMLVAMSVVLSLAIMAKPVLAQETTTFEEAFGAASALAMYNVQVVVGLTADAYAKDVYNGEDAKAVVAEQKGALTTLDGYVVKLLNLTTLTEADRKSLNDISGCLKKLGYTADALTAYIDSQTDDNANDFQAKRKDSYNTLAELLGLEKITE